MMNKKRLYLIGMMVLMMVLAACGGTAVSPTAAPEPEPEPAQEEVTAEPETEPESAEPAAGGARTFVVDSAASQASYIVNEEFFSEALTKLGIEAGKTVVIGTTPGVTGEIQIDLDAPDIVQAAQFTVDMTGLATDQNRRDNWLTENAIATGIFPEATFVATSASGLPDTVTEGEEISFDLTGDLTVRDVTNSVTFVVTAVLSANAIEGTATLPLKMTDFGITPPDFANTLTVADDFTIEVALTANE